jgi:hypothetical protein
MVKQNRSYENCLRSSCVYGSDLLYRRATAYASTDPGYLMMISLLTHSVGVELQAPNLGCYRRLS